MGRHTSTASSRNSWYAVAAGAVCILVVGGVAGGKALSGGSTTSGHSCDDPPTVKVAVADALYPTVFRAAEKLQGSGTCANYDVSDQSAADVDAAVRDGGSDVPDVWIPDSSMWVDDVTNKLGSGWLTQGGTLATSPVVIGVPHSMRTSKVASGKATWVSVLDDSVPLTVVKPSASSDTMVAMAAAQSAVQNKKQDRAYLQGILGLSRSTMDVQTLETKATQQPGSARLFPVSEQELIGFNSKHPKVPLGVLAPGPATPQLQYQWITPVRGSTAPTKAMNALHHALTSASGRATLRKAGFRVPSKGTSAPAAPAGSPLKADVTLQDPPSSKSSVKTISTWDNLAKDARMLVLVDVSGSMSDQMDPDKPGTSRIDVLRGLALGALNTMPRSTEIGAWAFSTNLRGYGKDWKPLSDGIHPVGPPTKSNTFRQSLVKAVGEMPKLVARNGDTALYDSVWAAYAQVSKTYDPKFVNSVVVLTDGKNEDTNGGLTLTQLLGKLKKSYDPQKPVKIVTISIGDGTDPAALNKIATTTNGLSYRPKNADEITSVFIDAFLHRN